MVKSIYQASVSNKKLQGLTMLNIELKACYLTKNKKQKKPFHILSLPKLLIYYE